MILVITSKCLGTRPWLHSTTWTPAYVVAKKQKQRNNRHCNNPNAMTECSNSISFVSVFPFNFMDNFETRRREKNQFTSTETCKSCMSIVSCCSVSCFCILTTKCCYVVCVCIWKTRFWVMNVVDRQSFSLNFSKKKPTPKTFSAVIVCKHHFQQIFIFSLSPQKFVHSAYVYTALSTIVKMCIMFNR